MASNAPGDLVHAPVLPAGDEAAGHLDAAAGKQPQLRSGGPRASSELRYQFSPP
jgi:hypothetical protein